MLQENLTSCLEERLLRRLVLWGRRGGENFEFSGQGGKKKNRCRMGEGVGVNAGGAFGRRSARKLHHGVTSLVANVTYHWQELQNK
jgi:hypothetical protein